MGMTFSAVTAAVGLCAVLLGFLTGFGGMSWEGALLVSGVLLLAVAGAVRWYSGLSTEIPPAP
ncbi:hypothetical protein [Arthrobacter sp. NEB 688]|uniref:hypothetical protein n=1 Tax=Arthrobacter sp. NEB 688 TaxID=904039 RepID=UPI001565E621|nr:hypothetical protein [Arthrobacter sp. NEB 688]QKE84872.1 hypothetical protein HL663_13600 [Arthrobacter sp. NEB 688]